MSVIANWFITKQAQLVEAMELELSVVKSTHNNLVWLNQMIVQSILKDKIREALLKDVGFQRLMDLVKIGHILRLMKMSC